MRSLAEENYRRQRTIMTLTEALIGILIFGALYVILGFIFTYTKSNGKHIL